MKVGTEGGCGVGEGNEMLRPCSGQRVIVHVQIKSSSSTDSCNNEVNISNDLFFINYNLEEGESRCETLMNHIRSVRERLVTFIFNCSHTCAEFHECPEQNSFIQMRQLKRNA